MFIIENKENSVIKITITDTLILDDLKKILGILSRIFKTKRNFAIYIHCDLNEIPLDHLNLIKYLLSWMKENHTNIDNYLHCSSIIIGDEKFYALFNNIFKSRPPIKPNYVTTNYKLGEEFVVDTMKELMVLKKSV